MMKRGRESEDFSSDTPTPTGEPNQDSSSSSKTSSPSPTDSHTMPAHSGPAMKIIELDDDTNQPNANEMQCSLPPHEPLTFNTYGEYESHYYSTHTNRCHECGKNFPSDHILNLHIEEIHDSFVAVKRERGEKTYSCFVESCDRKCSTTAKRNMHLIDKHMFPKNYLFDVTRFGIDGRHSLLRDGRHGHHPRSSRSTTPDEATATEGPTANDVIENFGTTAVATSVPVATSAPATASAPVTAPVPVDEASTAKDDQIELDTMVVETPDQKETPEEPVDQEMEDLTGAMSSLKFIPPSIRFGRGGRKGFAKN